MQTLVSPSSPSIATVVVVAVNSNQRTGREWCKYKYAVRAQQLFPLPLTTIAYQIDHKDLAGVFHNLSNRFFVAIRSETQELNFGWKNAKGGRKARQTPAKNCRTTKYGTSRMVNTFK